MSDSLMLLFVPLFSFNGFHTAPCSCQSGHLCSSSCSVPCSHTIPPSLLGCWHSPSIPIWFKVTSFKKLSQISPDPHDSFFLILSFLNNGNIIVSATKLVTSIWEGGCQKENKHLAGICREALHMCQQIVTNCGNWLKETTFYMDIELKWLIQGLNQWLIQSQLFDTKNHILFIIYTILASHPVTNKVVKK